MTAGCWLNCGSSASVVGESQSLFITCKKHRWGLVLLANCCTESQAKYTFVEMNTHTLSVELWVCTDGIIHRDELSVLVCSVFSVFSAS